MAMGTVSSLRWPEWSHRIKTLSIVDSESLLVRLNQCSPALAIFQGCSVPCSLARKRKLDVRPQTLKGPLAYMKTGGCLALPCWLAFDFSTMSGEEAEGMTHAHLPCHWKLLLIPKLSTSLLTVFVDKQRLMLKECESLAFKYAWGGYLLIRRMFIALRKAFFSIKSR